MNCGKASTVSVDLVTALFLVLALFAAAPPNAQSHLAQEGEKGIETIVEKRSWNAVRITPRIFKLELVVPTCDGLRPPKVVKKGIVEHSKEVIITVWVHWELANSCLGVERFVHTRVKLKKHLGHRRLKDGSTSPPTRRWPE
jgi:hypothetical protein